ncbi:MAG: NifB/NifX family molybdenum-iron cluster-binding protein [Acidilobus sp.]
MKVAVPVGEDCRTPSVIRSGYFLVLEFPPDGTKLISSECRRVDANPPQEGSHRHYRELDEEEHEHGPEHARWHLAVLNALKDVDIVIAPHMGPTMVRALQSLGKRILTGLYASDPSDIREFLKEVGVFPNK